ncbi:hypothetical protein A1OO_17300 [Enterovibrio norvegicus FF-33]|uniref:hypothetical protein n=1 Tax=Enterovibrio TaxID=188143 RepID=UPI000318B9DD|nr:hypothetical protein [Enterovibrio norvegicus]OEE67502.1 hypothetical protein A1OO_17300 [Enterovibrio norvegicus FF-33]OEE81755.1 hypothetical protein A1OQ_20595 [Enterovibrio norvegicus FF-162]
MKKHYAGVITGDIVGSTDMSESTRQACLAALKRCFEDFGERDVSGETVGEIYRGDAFQLYTNTPERVFDMAMTIRIALKSIDGSADARLSLSVAPATQRELPVRMANNSDAFILSGRRLDTMKSQRLAFTADEIDFASDVNLVVSLLDDHITQLTTKMAVALSVWMKNPTAQHTVLAQKLGITRSAFTRIINRAHYARIEETSKWYADRLSRYQCATEG